MGRAKWKVRKGSKVDPGSILMTYKIVGGTETRKLKSQQIGTIVELYKKEGDIVGPRLVKKTNHKRIRN